MKGLYWLKGWKSIVVIVLTIPICLGQTAIAFPAPILTPTPILSWDELQTLARQITVKVRGVETSGSGILVNKRGNTYTVLTNDHVLRSGSYQVQTSDGQWKTANQIAPPIGKSQDSAFLQFTSSQPYPIAKFGNTQNLKTGNPIYVMGFPFDSRDADTSGWRSTKGAVLMRSETALEDGYQLAYTNDTVKGMSGGPVLNSLGEVVALHGQGPAIIDVTVKDEQGREFCSGMQQFISNYSWGIPIERILPTVNNTSVDSLRTSSLLEQVDFQSFDRISSFNELVLSAEVTSAKACENLVLKSEPKDVKPWFVFGANNKIISSFTGGRSN